MAFSFSPEAAVLDLGPRRPREHRHRVSWEYILWPGWSYRVVAPRARDRKLNMFQRAALGLCKAGRQDFASIARFLSIHPDLAAFILFELTERGYVDKYGLATDSGERTLDEDSSEVHDMLAGYVFQDPWTGDLWPRFVEHLNYCELDYDESGFPALLLGAGGKSWRQGAFMMLPVGTSSPARPSPAKVISAVAGQRRGLRDGDSLPGWEDESVLPGHLPSTAHFDRVTFIEEEPKPIFLMTYLYITDSDASIGDWNACDPFGFGASVRLRRRVEQLMLETPGLRRVVNRLVGRGVHDGLEEQRRWQAQLRATAIQELEKRFSEKIGNHDAFNWLLDVELARQEASLLGNDCPEYKIQSARRSCLKCLEAVFGGMTRKHPLGDVWKCVYVPQSDPVGRIGLTQQQDRVWLEVTYRTAATEVGFAEPIPRPMLGIRPGHIRSVAEHDEQWRLRPLVMASILSARTNPQHPLRAAAQAAPGLLRDIDNIARQGAKAGHAAEDQEAVMDLSTMVKLTYSVVSVLIGFGPGADAGLVSETGGDDGKG